LAKIKEKPRGGGLLFFKRHCHCYETQDTEQEIEQCMEDREKGFEADPKWKEDLCVGRWVEHWNLRNSAGRVRICQVHSGTLALKRRSDSDMVFSP